MINFFKEKKEKNDLSQTSELLLCINAVLFIYIYKKLFTHQRIIKKILSSTTVSNIDNKSPY